MKNIIYFYLTLLVTLFTNHLLSYSTINVEFPTLNSHGISIDPEIKLSIDSPFMFDLSKLPSSLEQYSRFPSETDSLHYMYSQIYLVSNTAMNICNNDIHLASLLSPLCYLDTIINGVITIKPERSLDLNSSYSLVLRDLRYINPNTNDTLFLDTVITNYFVTTLPITKLKYCNLQGNPYLSFNTPIITTFSNKVISSTSPFADLFELYKVTGESVIDSNYFQYNLTQINFNVF